MARDYHLAGLDLLLDTWVLVLLLSRLCLGQWSDDVLRMYGGASVIPLNAVEETFVTSAICCRDGLKNFP